MLERVEEVCAALESGAEKHGLLLQQVNVSFRGLGGGGFCLFWNGL